MTNSHGYVLEYPRIRVDHFDQALVPLPASLLAHRCSVSKGTFNSPAQEQDSLPFAPNQTHFDKPLLYLLTHIHTDHLKGLDRPGTTAPIYCTHATKQLLLKYERQKTRIEKDCDGTHTKHIGVVRPYAHLRVSDTHANAKAKLSGYQSTSLDLLQPLPYNVPTKVQYTPKSSVMLTLIESNHMMGGCMFLIQGSQGAVLHTGDMRAERWWCDALTRNPYLSPYLCWSGKPGEDGNVGADYWADHMESFGSSTTTSSLRTDDSQSQTQLGSQSQSDSYQHHSHPPSASSGAPKQPERKSQLRLRNIYLDTELLLCLSLPPSKQQACLDVISLLRLFPPTTIFFLNCWTWGYEDLLIYVAKAFGCKIHVDRFKYIMYRAARSEVPFLADIVTQDGSKTRFHACEKRNTCSVVSGLASRYAANGMPELAKEAIVAHSQIDSCSDDARMRWGPVRSQPEPLLVYVNPGQIGGEKWGVLFEDTKQRVEAAGRGETAWPEALVVPIERYSTLPELQMFVGLFRPKTVSPNTILDPKGGLDYYLLHYLFGHLLAGAEDRRKLADEGLLMLGNTTWSFYETQLARAREQAQARRANGAGVGDSTEATCATSASLNVNGGQSFGESLDAYQLEKLSKLRGISFKGLVMQNMAGNLAAMLEIERWRRAAGIEEELEGSEEVLEETQRSGDASVKSVDYDADCSQAETQAVRRRNETAAARAESSHGVATPSWSGQSSHGNAEQSIGSVAAVAPQESQVSESVEDDEEEQGSTAMSEDLASRYLNVLIHHFNVPFNRTDGSYVQMWKTVRRKMSENAQKVEEHWFRETGILPPLWDSQAITTVVHPPESEPAANGGEGRTGEGSVFGDILVSFIDMLRPTPAGEGKGEMMAVSTEHDRTAALQLILRHFARLGLQNRFNAESSSEGHALAGQIQASCVADATEWSHLGAALTDLTRHLASTLQQVSVTGSVSARMNKVEAENMILALQVAGVILSYRLLNAVTNRTAVQMLLERLITIVEAASTERGDRTRSKMVALASAVLRAEELEEDILTPFESRLLALVQDPNGPLRRIESFVDTETGLSEGVSQPGQEENPQPQPARPAAHPSPGQASVEVVEESIDAEADASSLQIRALRAPSTIPAKPLQVASSPRIATIAPISNLSEEPQEEDSIIAIRVDEADDTIESAAAFQPEASQASSATQEEDSTQSEEAFTQSQLGSLPPPTTRTVAAELRRREDGRRLIGRTSSLPTFRRDAEQTRKRKRKNESTPVGQGAAKTRHT
ncbi:hypothetical protein NDA18_000846 [Ustilago nuda]|nr:hypothetical protein NDA18_001846 [Ustilago nuda]KAJ1035250.1 hypothetical protein NDA18_000846 [Ustilago nuda]